MRCKGLKRIQLIAFIGVLAASLFLGGCQKEKNPADSSADITLSTASPVDTATNTSTNSISQTNAVTPTTGITETRTPSEAAEEAGFQLQNDSKAEIVRAYGEAYERTVAEVNLKGTEAVSILKGTLRLGGKTNAVAEAYANSQIGRFFEPRSPLALPLEQTAKGSCLVKEADIKIASRRESETEIVIKLISKDSGFPMRGQGGAGNLMDVPDIGLLEQLIQDNGVLFSNGKGFEENVTIEFMGAECTAIIEKKTGLITRANYRLLIFAQAEHVSVSVLKNLDVAATVCYEMTYPQ